MQHQLNIITYEGINTLIKNIIKKIRTNKTKPKENNLVDEIIKHNKEILSSNKKEKVNKNHNKKEKN